MYRKLILAGVACFALSTAAYAGNTATVVQLGGQTNLSTIAQVGTYHWASTTQVGKNNISLNGQGALFGNTSLVNQVSTSVHHGSNTAVNGQGTVFGDNVSGISQYGTLNNAAGVAQGVLIYGSNYSGISQIP